MKIRGRDWLFVLLILVVAVSKIILGVWQLRRHAERRDKNDLIAARMTGGAEELGLEELNSEQALYHRARLYGQFDTLKEIVLKSRSHNGQPGYYLVTPLKLEQDQGILIDRGWIANDEADREARAKNNLTGPISLEGILLPSQKEPGIGFMADPTLSAENPRLSAWRVLDVERIQEQIPYTLLPHYVLLTSNLDEPAHLLLDEPEIDSGPHLGYAAQWFAFTLVALVGGAFWLKHRSKEQALNEES